MLNLSLIKKIQAIFYTVMNDIIATRYAKSLFALLPVGKRRNALQEIATFVEVLNAFGWLKKYLFNKYISRKAKQMFLDEILVASGFLQEVKNFILVLHSNNRLYAIESVVSILHKLVLDAENKLQVNVYTAHKVKKGEMDALVPVLEEVFKKEVLIDHFQNADLLGGVKIQIGSLLCDMSVQKVLAQLQQACVNR